MKKLIYLTLFFLITPLTLGVGIFTLTDIRRANNTKIIPILSPQVLGVASNNPSRVFAALPKEAGTTSGEFILSDARPLIIENYLKKYKSPMAPYYLDLLSAAERYQVDPWLIIAIAQCESNLCKKSPPGSYNCWGFENGETRFFSWGQAFDQVAKTLRERYLDVGLDTPEEIMAKYAPPSVEKGGPWAKCVTKFIEEIERGGP
jgi:hypothetical protein